MRNTNIPLDEGGKVVHMTSARHLERLLPVELRRGCSIRQLRATWRIADSEDRGQESGAL